MSELKYLQQYAPSLLERVQTLIADGTLGEVISRKYPERHHIQTDKALYQYVGEFKQRYLKSAPALAKVLFDNQMDLVRGTLGTQTQISRVQGTRLKSKNEVRIAALFRDAPEAFLRMIVVHELAHLKEKQHDKAFYKLCCHMEPDYHQLEFDMRLWLTWRDMKTGT
jgi:predicted metal-dependent hydrolase